MASIHSGFDAPRDELTKRMCAAMENPHVDCIGHPTGRKLNRRAAYDLDFDAVFATAQSRRARSSRSTRSRTGSTCMAAHARAADEAGVRIVVSTDAHRIARAREPRARRLPGAARLADEGRRREHAHVGAGQEAEEAVTLGRLPPRRRRRARVGRALPRGRSASCPVRAARRAGLGARAASGVAARAGRAVRARSCATSTR